MSTKILYEALYVCATKVCLQKTLKNTTETYNATEREHAQIFHPYFDKSSKSICIYAMQHVFAYFSVLVSYTGHWNTTHSGVYLPHNSVVNLIKPPTQLSGTHNIN